MAYLAVPLKPTENNGKILLVKTRLAGRLGCCPRFEPMVFEV